MTREEQNALLDTARRCYEAVLAANPSPVLTPCKHCGGHEPPNTPQKLGHQFNVRLTAAVEKIKNIRWVQDEDKQNLPLFQAQESRGTDVAGWRKQPKGHWTYKDTLAGLHQTAAVGSSDLIPGIVTDGGDPFIELPVVLDLLAQIINPNT